MARLIVPLGYVIKNDRLVVEPKEKKLVLEIFTRYAEQESVTTMLHALNERGERTKQWQTRTGKQKGGKPFNRNAIYTLLKNRVYLGEVFYANCWQKGSHEPIISPELWAEVEGLLSSRSRRGESRPSTKNDNIFLLKGKLFGADGRAMSPWLSSKYKSRQYAYYIPQRDIAEGAGASGLPRIQAGNAHKVVWGYLRNALSNPDSLLNHLPSKLLNHPSFDRDLVVRKLQNLEGISEYLFPIYQKHIFLQIIKRITLHRDKLDFTLNLDGLMDLILELLSDKPDLAANYRSLYVSFKPSKG